MLSRKKIIVAILGVIIIFSLYKIFNQEKEVKDIPFNIPSSMMKGFSEEKDAKNTISLFDCTQVACPPIFINGDNYTEDRSPFSGFNDPSIRKDPNANRLWMTYSFLYEKQKTSTPGVEVHYAHSDDGGGTWQYDGPLWTSEEVVTAIENQQGSIEQELSNILAVDLDGRTKWYGVRLNYFLPEGGKSEDKQMDSFYITLSESETVSGLRDGPSIKLGSGNTNDSWSIDMDLSKLDASLSNCIWWNDPALYSEDGILYLGLRCMRFTGENVFMRPDIARSDIVIFESEPIGNITDWVWRFSGILAGGQEAHELGGVGLGHIDFSKGKDGTLLFITSPDEYTNERKYKYHGCRVIEMEKKPKLSLARHSNGALKVHAWIEATDQGKLGPGACSYEAESQNGLIMVRREIEKNKLWASIHSTGIKP